MTAPTATHAPSAVARLYKMGIEPFLIASTVRTVIGQRLVRRIGPNKETYQSSAVETEAVKKNIGHLLPATDADRAKVSEDLGFKDLPLRDQPSYSLTRGVNGVDMPEGYKGRMGLYEVFDVTENIQGLILKHATSAEIQKAAQAQGMVTMREDGYLKALAGATTVNEVNRVAAADNA